jgi:hypothetical protein
VVSAGHELPAKMRVFRIVDECVDDGVKNLKL